MSAKVYAAVVRMLGGDPMDDWEQRSAAAVRKAKRVANEQCLPIGLVVGLVFSFAVPAAGAYFDKAGFLSLMCIVVMFVISGLKLKTDEFYDALKSTTGCIFGLISILILTPLIGVGLSSLVHLEPIEFQQGLNLFFCTPCAINASVIFSKQAGGNSALSLLLTVAASLLGIFSTPLLLSTITSFGSVSFPVVDMIIKLLLAVLLPLLVGKALQECPLGDHAVRRACGRHGKALGYVSNAFLVMIPWMKISAAASRGDLARVSLGDVGAASVWFCVVHAAFLAFNLLACNLIGMDDMAKRTVVMTASTKTLPLSLTVLGLLPPGMVDAGLAALPCVLAQFIQTLADSCVASLWAKGRPLPAQEND
mmetsp:Transcript_2864/g.7847  ORF Transcript_2864/g.7847 Transcript_2864/m.7847 type:complete len:365 (-) Transcript_2864:321-1415(-)